MAHALQVEESAWLLVAWMLLPFGTFPGCAASREL